MNRSDIEQALRGIIHEVAPDVAPDGFASDEDLAGSLAIDSFDHLRIVSAMSERFGVAVPEADQGGLRTLADLVEYVATRRVT